MNTPNGCESEIAVFIISIRKYFGVEWVDLDPQLLADWFDNYLINCDEFCSSIGKILSNERPII